MASFSSCSYYTYDYDEEVEEYLFGKAEFNYSKAEEKQKEENDE